MKLVMTAVAVAIAGAIGLGVQALPAGAGVQPSLPPVSPEDLVASVLTAKVPALGGTVTVRNALGLPALPDMAGPLAQPLLTQPESTVRVWSDGQGHGRLALPSRSGEQNFIEDGSTLWRYDSASRTATAWEHGTRPAQQRLPVADPAQAARQLVGALRTSSTISVDGTGTVAGQSVYQLVLTPAPTERTLLREVRVAIDSAHRIPLQLTMLANGSPDPALQVGFSDLTVGAQDPALFQFTPPAGVTVERPKHEPKTGARSDDRAGAMIRTEGEGWDTVVLGQLPAAPPVAQGDPAQGDPTQGDPTQRDPLAMIQRVGRPVSGPWGNGWVVQTAVGTVLVSSDGRVAAGAVPQQVLDEALSR